MGNKLTIALNRVKNKGLVKKIGVSIYDPSECEELLKLTRFDIVQAPLNIVDRRLVDSGWLSKLHSDEIEIHTRSVFLQGLLLMPRYSVPENFKRWSFILDKWSSELKNYNLSAVEVCLLYTLSFPEIDRVIVGVDNVSQLSEIIKKSQSNIPNLDWSFMMSDDKMLIDPRNWNI